MQNVKNIFQLDYSEYERLSSYLKLETKEEIFNILNQKLLLFSKYKNFSRLDVFIKKIKKNIINIYYLDFFIKFFFKKSILRYQLNLILAIHESDYDNFQIILKNRNIYILFYELLMFVFVLISFPIWLLIIIFLNIFRLL
jgi:hypothetical protein